MMLFRTLAEHYSELESVSSRLKMMEILSSLFKITGKDEIKFVIYITQGILLPPFEGLEFGVAEKIMEDAISLATGYEKDIIESSYNKSGDLGIVAFDFKSKTKLKRMSDNGYNVSDIYHKMYKIANTNGPGSKDLKIKMIAELIASSTDLEAKYITRYVLGELRLGVGDYTILEALSLAYVGNREEKQSLEYAYNLCSDMGEVGECLAKNGIESIKKFDVSLFKPLRPELAERLPTAEEIIERMGGVCSVEQKYDGFRCQIHKSNNKVKIYSRNLEETTDMFPDLKEAVINDIKSDTIIFEGEALAFNDVTNEFLPFQETIQRKRKHGIKEKSTELPLHLFAFDIIYLNGRSLINEPYSKRRSIIEKLLNTKIITPTKRILTSSPKEFELFFDKSIEDGLEGIVAKDLKSTYVAGARKFSWIKMKRSYKGILSDTLDLVIIGYFLGRGSRAEFKFGGLLCAVYNKERDIFESISKIGTGFTEDNMRMFSDLLGKIKLANKPARVDSIVIPDFWVEPRYVITVRADEITKSPTHTCGKSKNESGLDIGYALRFPRIIENSNIRTDKSAEDATTTSEVIAMYNDQKKISSK